MALSEHGIEVKRLQLLTRRVLRTDLMGEYRSAFRGSGLAFAELREYQPGDDIRHIHWKVTARSKAPYVKVYEEERELQVYVLLDQSLSMSLGYEHSRLFRARLFTSVVAHLAAGNRDKIGFCSFDSKVLEFLRASSRPFQIQRVLWSATDVYSPTANAATDPSVAMRTYMQRVKRASLVFLISDFYCQLDPLLVRSLSQRHDLVLVSVEDVLDEMEGATGLMRIADPESGYARLVDAGSSRVKKALHTYRRRRRESLQEIATQSGVDVIFVEQEVVAPLQELMARRKRVHGL